MMGAQPMNPASKGGDPTYKEIGLGMRLGTARGRGRQRASWGLYA